MLTRLIAFFCQTSLEAIGEANDVINLLIEFLGADRPQQVYFVRSSVRQTDCNLWSCVLYEEGAKLHLEN